MDTILQYRNGLVVKDNFELVLVNKTMESTTPVYFMVTSGKDGSYIVNNFVSKVAVPAFEK